MISRLVDPFINRKLVTASQDYDESFVTSKDRKGEGENDHFW